MTTSIIKLFNNLQEDHSQATVNEAYTHLSYLYRDNVLNRPTYLACVENLRVIAKKYELNMNLGE